MTIILFLLLVSLMLGALGLVVFLWSLRSGQYDDLDGAANRILFDGNCPGSSAKSGLWPRQRPESQFFQRKFAYRPPLRGGTWAPSRGTWAVTIFSNSGDRRGPDDRVP